MSVFAPTPLQSDAYHIPSCKMQSVKMSKLQLVSFIFAMMAAVIAYPVFSNDPIRNRELHKVIRRHIFVKTGECPEGFIKLSFGCVLWDLYNEIKADDYDKITTESEVENTTPQPGQTPGHTRPVHPGTMSGVDYTPHPQTRSSPGPTKRPHKTPPPTSTSQSPSTPSPTTTSRPAPVLVSRVETTSSLPTMTATVLFLLCLCLIYRTV